MISELQRCTRSGSSIGAASEQGASWRAIRSSARQRSCVLAGLLIALALPAVGTAQVAVDRYTNLSGVWLDAEREAQGLMIEQLDSPWPTADGSEPRVGVTWFTWAPEDDPVPGPRWMFGVGRRNADTIVVDPVMIAVRGSYPAADGDAPAEIVPWGRVELRFAGQSPGVPNEAALQYEGPDAWGTGERTLRQITVASTGLPYNLILDPPFGNSLLASAGTYSDPLSSGQGWIINHYGRDDPPPAPLGMPRVETALLWFSYDAQQRPTWSIGFDDDLLDGVPEFAMLQATAGGTFEGGTPVLEPWGHVRVRGSGGPPQGINCGEPRFVDLLAASTAGQLSVPPVTRAIARITSTYDPNVLPPGLCFSR